jgi:dTMP kinase
MYNHLTGLHTFVEEQQLLSELKNTWNNVLKKEPKKNKGLLIVFEGIDGAGKSSQTDLLLKWLKDRGYDVLHTKWNSSKIVEKATQAAKDKRELTPMLYCLLHAADMLHRYDTEIMPALENNKIVVSDRYVYTSAVRDKARNVDVDLLKSIYQGLRQPDILFHCWVPIKVALERLKDEKRLTYYGTGSDLELADSREENYVKYEEMLDKLYNELLPRTPNYHKLNMNRSIEKIHDEVKRIMADEFGIGKY